MEHITLADQLLAIGLGFCFAALFVAINAIGEWYDKK